MFVFHPSLSVSDGLLANLKTTTPPLFAEQDYLNWSFKDIFKPISSIYNLVLPMLWRHPENIDLEITKVVHYCAVGSKPWMYTGQEENMDREDIKMLVKKWWDIYNDESLDYGYATANEQLLEKVPTEAGEMSEITFSSAA